MRRCVVCVVIVSVLVIGASSRTVAQDGSPAANPPARDLSLLRDLGLPEIDLIATDAAVTGVEPDVAAGRYLVTLENQTADQTVEIEFVAPPPGISQEQALGDLGGETETSEAPDWFYAATWAGGPTADADQTDGVVVDLAAGDWWLSADRTANSEVQPTGTNVALHVTGDLPAAGEIVDAIPVTLQEYAFAFPATVPSGPQIWQLTNTGEQPHLLDLVGVPEDTTFGQVMDLLSSALTGTPAASALGFEQIRDVYSTPTISPGQSLGIKVDLAPGTYVVVCFIPDRESGAPHALIGMIQVFTVA